MIPDRNQKTGKSMKNHSQSRFMSRRECLAAVGAAGCLLQPGFSLANEQQSAAGGFESLFDGKTLDGWHTNPEKIGHGTGGRWTIDDGIIVGEQDPPGSGNGGLLLSDRKFANFELTVEMRPDWGVDSGVFFRCTDRGAGFQMYVDYHDGGNVGHLRGEMPGSFAIKPFQIFGDVDEAGKLAGFSTDTDSRSRRWPEGVYEYACTPQQWLDTWKIGEWNTAKIRCIGKYPQITTWINGVKVCHFDGEDSTLPGYDKKRVFKQLGRSGSIGLQVHGGAAWAAGEKCRWKNIFLKEL